MISLISYSLSLFLHHLIPFWLVGSFFFICDWLVVKYQLVEKWKYGNIGTYQYFYKEWRVIYGDCLLVAIITQLIIVLPLIVFTLGIFELHKQLELEDPRNLVIKIFIMVMIEETLFYHLHRLLHSHFLYKYHAIHHQLIMPVSIGAIYAHELEQILTNFGPVILSLVMVNASFPLACYWTVFTTILTLISHCGFVLFEQRHDQHHKKFNINYGVIGLFDFLYNTNEKRFIKISIANH